MKTKSFLWGGPLFLVWAMLLAACGTLNPVSVAQTTEQKVWALYGQFVVYEEQAAALVRSPSVSPETKARIKAADQVAHPLAEALFTSAQAVIETKRLVAAGDMPAEELAKRQVALDTAYLQAVAGLLEFVRAVSER